MLGADRAVVIDFGASMTARRRLLGILAMEEGV